MVSSIILFIKVPIYRPRDLDYVKCFWEKSSSVKFTYQQVMVEKEHFPRHQSLYLRKLNKLSNMIL